MIDLVMWLAGNPRPSTATASMTRLFPRKRGIAIPEFARPREYDVEDLAFGHVRFESGFWMTIEGGWTWDAPEFECRFDLVGDAGQASAPPVRFSSVHDGQLLHTTADADGALGGGQSFPRQLRDVISAVREGRPPLVTGRQALQVQAVVDALYRSAASGREVEVADVGGVTSR
jgi:predicted dehydrogenase